MRKRETTLALLADCFEELGGVPAVVLSDRVGCLKAGVVATRWSRIPTTSASPPTTASDPDFCEAADPESKGVVENLVGYAQRDLVAPAQGFVSVEEGNLAAVFWGLEVNGKMHSETQAVPQERLLEERELLRPLPSLRPPLRQSELRKVDRLQTVRFGLRATRCRRATSGRARWSSSTTAAKSPATH